MADCHMHMILDGKYWRSAIDRHRRGPDIPFIRSVLDTYARMGVTYLRDGGDRWGAGAAARALAGEYGITYRTPLAPIHRKGHYGGFIGLGYGDLREFANLVRLQGKRGADFVKIMISGLMDFDRPGVLSEEPLPPAEIKELIHIAHEEGFSVMAHCNGAGTAEAAAEAGVDSIEHGAYLDDDALCAMREFGTVWVPTLSTVEVLLHHDRYNRESAAAILESGLENVRKFGAMGGLIAVGSDAGAWQVFHGWQNREAALLKTVLGDEGDAILTAGTEKIKEKF